MGGLTQTKSSLVIIINIIVLRLPSPVSQLQHFMTLFALSSRRRREETEIEKEKERMSFGAVSGRFGQSRGLLGRILSRNTKHSGNQDLLQSISIGLFIS